MSNYSADEIALAEQIYVRLVVHTLTSPTGPAEAIKLTSKDAATIALDAAQAFYNRL